MAAEPVIISVLSYGAKGDNKTDDTKAIQAAIDQGYKIGGIVLFPNGSYRVSQLVLRAGSVLQGVSSGTYPDNENVSGSSVLVRIANTNKHLLLAPEGANYCRITDLAIDGNKNNNNKGYGLCVADAVAGHESQTIVNRCYIHTNPESNIYLGRNRRANTVESCVLNYSLTGDGITVAGSDNTIAGNIIGTNARAGICLGTTATQNWGASSPNFSANIAHVNDNDIYGNLVGIAVANGSSGCMISGNGIDRNKYQGATVYSGASNTLVTNSFHSNGTAKNNTYAHVDVGQGVKEVCISNNNFTPLDSGITNNASYCVYIAPGATRVIGDIGCTDPTAAIARTNAQAGAVPGTTLSLVGAVVQGVGSDIFVLKNKAGKVVWKISDGGTVVSSGIEGMPVAGIPGATEGARFVGSTKSGAPASGTWTAGDFAIDQTGTIWIYNGAKWVAGGAAAGDAAAAGSASASPASASSATVGSATVGSASIGSASGG
jgi:parallel beta-helix repeat protein